jgi:zinc protease
MPFIANSKNIGADLSFGSGTFTVSWSGKALAEDLPVLIGNMRASLRQPTFPEDLFEVLRQQRLTDMTYRAQDTRYQAGRAFREALYPDNHPYHYSIAGTPESVQSLTVDDLRAFHAQQFGARGMIIVVVGNVDPQEATAQVAQALGDWRNDALSPLPDLPTVPQPTMLERISTPIEGKTQSDIVMGRLGPARHDAHYRAASLANSVLGEFGMMGRIGRVIREESGLAYLCL